MVIWILFALMTAGLLAAVLRPLLAEGRAPRARVLSSSDVYRGQLAELEVERAAGRVAEAEYQAARAEIGRRLIKSAAAEPAVDETAGEGGAAATCPPPSDEDGGQPLSSEKGKGKKLPWLALAVTIAVPAFALPFYLYVGNPDYPDQPLASRGPEVARAREIEQLTAELEAKLKSGKGDAKGWAMLGSVKAQLGDADAAIEAYGHAIAMLKAAGQSVPADLSAALGQAEVAKAGGQITPRAVEAFRAALAVDPKNTGARFYLAESKAASGDIAGAITDYRALLADTPANAPYRPMIEKRLTDLEAANNK